MYLLKRKMISMIHVAERMKSKGEGVAFLIKTLYHLTIIFCLAISILLLQVLIQLG